MAGGAAGPRIGVALGGGAAHGFAHIPMLEVLDELGVRPAKIAGTSMGAVIGASYAAGMGGKDIRAWVTEIFGSRSRFLQRLLKTLPASVTEIAFGVGQYDLERILRAFLPDGFPEDFSGLAIPARFVATDFYSGEAAVIGEGPLLRAVAASAAVPMLFRPVVIAGRVMIDGGVTNPVPFDLLADMDVVVAFDVVTRPTGDPHKPPGGFAALFGAASILMESLFREKMKANRAPDLLVRPPTGGYNVLDFTKAAAIIEAAAATKDQVKRQLEALLAAREALPRPVPDHRSGKRSPHP